jgi:Skp family chaperone for outer membrane proteins
MADTILAEPPPNPATSALIEGLQKWEGKNQKLAPEPAKAQEMPSPQPVAEPTAPEPAKTEPKVEHPEFKLPSFVTGEEPPKPAEPPKEEISLEQLPAQPPATASEKEKINWSKARKLMERQETELKDLRLKAADREAKGKQPDETTTKRIAELEIKNKQYEEFFQRQSIENHPAFVQQVIRPMQAAYSDAQRIISEAGGDTAALDRAIALGGKAHYDAMDEILSGLPESAKGELTATMRDYSRYAKQRQSALANAPQVAEDMRRQDEARQLQYLTQHKEQLSKKFDDVLKHTRDVVGFELLRKSDNPGDSQWNQMVDNIVEYGRGLALENQDEVKMLQASILAPAAITLRDLWLKAEKRASTAEKELSALRNSEPSMSSSGAPSNGTPSKDDLKKPFKDLFTDVLKTKPWEK